MSERQEYYATNLSPEELAEFTRLEREQAKGDRELHRARDETGRNLSNPEVSIGGDGTPTVIDRVIRDGNSYHKPKGILDSARTAVGVPIPRNDISESTVVEVPGFGHMAVREALTLGFLEYNADGKIVEASFNAGATGRDKDEVEDDDAEKQDDDKSDKAQFTKHLTETSKEVGAETFNAVAETLIVGGEDAVPEEYKESASVAVSRGEKIVDAALSDLGVTSDHLRDYAADNPKEFRDAVQQLTSRGSVDGFRSMATNYLSSLSASDVQQMQHGEGVEVREEPNGKAAVNIPGKGWISFGRAISDGLIRISRP